MIKKIKNDTIPSTTDEDGKKKTIAFYDESSNISRLQDELIQMKVQLNVNEHKMHELESFICNTGSTPEPTTTAGGGEASATVLSSPPPLSSSFVRRVHSSSNPDLFMSARMFLIENDSEKVDKRRTKFLKQDAAEQGRSSGAISKATATPASTGISTLFFNSNLSQSESTSHSKIQETQLTRDIYSLMMTKRTLSKSWFFAILIFSIQFCLLALIFQNQISSSVGTTVFNVPFKVTTGVRVAQLLAIFISIMISYDILIPIRDLSMLWITNDCEWSKVVVGIHRFDYSSIKILLRVFDYYDDNEDDTDDTNDTNDGNKTTNCCSSMFDITGTTQDKKKKKILWILHILIPNICKFIQGVLVLLITFVIVIQSDSIIDLFKDFAAMQVISELDNVAFHLADHGYFGSDLKEDTSKVKDIQITDDVPKICGQPLRPVIFCALFGMMVTIFFRGVVVGQQSGDFFHDKYPMCKVMDLEIIETIADGVCQGGLQNTFQCGFDGGVSNSTLLLPDILRPF